MAELGGPGGSGMVIGQSPAAERERVLSLLRERILAFAASRTGRDAAEDLAQDVLMLLHGKYGQLERLEELLPLAFRILRFKMAALFRKARRRGEGCAVPVEQVQIADLSADPAGWAERRELLERLKSALPRLRPRCREIFRLKLEGKTFSEIQALMRAASINTIYTWDARCRKRLLELMGGSWEVRP